MANRIQYSTVFPTGCMKKSSVSTVLWNSAPTTTLMAFIRFDEIGSSFLLISRSLPDKHPALTALKDYPGEYTYKYPKAGYPNSKVEVRTYDIKSHVTRTMKLPLDADGYIPRIRFTKDANKLGYHDIKPSSRPFRPLLCRSSLNTLQTNASVMNLLIT